MTSPDYGLIIMYGNLILVALSAIGYELSKIRKLLEKGDE